VRKYLGRPSGRRLSFAALAAMAIAALTVLGASGLAEGGNGKGPGLSKADRAVVATAKVKGKDKVSLLVMTEAGATAPVASALKGFGATIVRDRDVVGYIKADVPTENAIRAATVSGIKAVTVDRAIPAYVPQPEKQGASSTPAFNPSAVGAINDYMPTGAIGAPQFIQANPTYDGRGAKVGIADTGVDLDRPELQTALDLNSKPVRKIYDWVTTTAPDSGAGDPTWVPMTKVTTSRNDISTDAGKYHLPNAGGSNWVFGVFAEGDPRLGGELGSDVNRDGDSNDVFGVVEDTATKTVWIDTNQNNNFNDDQPMTDYKVKYDVGHFGKDRVNTRDVVESVPFTVQTTDDASYVNIGIVSGGHGTHVAGTIAGKGFFGGRFDGVAPNAQLAVARVCLFVQGCFISDQLDAFDYLITQDHVDAIQMSIGGLSALNDDANDFESAFVNNYTLQYGVQFFFSNGNDGPGANTVGSPAVAQLAIGSGAYQTKGTWAANYGATVSKNDTLWTFSSRGPREDGGLKPNVIAPGAELSTWPAWNMSENPFAGGLGSRPYTVQPGYEMIQGTSMASPMTAGEGALLISAAKQNGFTPTTRQLRKAIQSGTTVVPNYQAYEQGNGLINVAKAWDVLKTQPTTVCSFCGVTGAKINTVITRGIPGYTGWGLYEREGLKPGESGDRELTFQSSLAGTYDLKWVGDPTFSSTEKTVTITPGANGIGTASVHVHFGPLTAGIHSAILQFDLPGSAGVEYASLQTVVAAQQFPADTFKIASGDSHPARADKESFFINVAPGTGALKLDETITSGRTRLDIVDPFGDPYVLPIPCSCANDFTTAPATRTTVIQSPMAGVWEVDVEASRTSTADPATASFTATALGVAISPAVWAANDVVAGSTLTQAFQFTNSMAPFNGLATGTDLGSAQKKTLTATDDHDPGTADVQQEVKITVPAGAPSLHVEIGNPTDPNSDLDLLVFDPSGNLVGVSAGPTPNESVTIDSPAAGTYTAVIDDFSVPSGSTEYRYLDTIPLPGLGAVTVADTAKDHPTGDKWSATATAKPLGSPGAGRIWEGFVQVKAGDSVIGHADVDLTPKP
jgi:hypothetical protein